MSIFLRPALDLHSRWYLNPVTLLNLQLQTQARI